MEKMTLARAGAFFNDATFRLEGGVTPANMAAIIADLQHTQEIVQRLVGKGPLDTVTAIHEQNVVDQLGLEIQHIQTAGTDAFAPKFINDIHRDIIDIVQGDAVLAAQAGNGFGVVPNLLQPPVPFHDNADQTAFLATFTQDSSDYQKESIAFVTANLNSNTPSADEQALIAHIRDVFLPDANAFSHAQGGVYSARFDNELAHGGVAETAAKAMINGLQHGDLAEVTAAGTVLVQNAADLNGNHLPVDGVPAPVVNPIPATFDTFGQVGVVFNDATVKLIGGVFDTAAGSSKASILADLTAVGSGLQQVTTAHPEQFTGTALENVGKIEALINTELAAVGVSATDPLAAQHIHDSEISIIGIVQNDAVLKALAAADNGFQALPAPLHPAEMLVVHNEHGGHGHGDWHFHA